VLNDLDRFHRALDVLARVPRLRNDAHAEAAAAFCRAKLAEHRAYVVAHGRGMPEIRGWRWPG
jgi:xylulose-5-phosphate/fructose-6-phosphate phosphoketolase